MVNVANPNFKSKNRLRARASKARKASQKAAGRPAGQIERADAKRGARPGLLPTSGPRKPLSGKKQRKLEKKIGYALKRKMEAEGEVVMKGASATRPGEQLGPGSPDLACRCSGFQNGREER
jgi:hypothetical protein